jgi:hypothetical protein
MMIDLHRRSEADETTARLIPHLAVSLAAWRAQRKRR